MSRRALLLDKDGVINADHGYVCTPERTDFIGGIFDLCRAATEHGWLVVVVTNQAGIARGHYTEQAFLDYMDWVRNEFRKRDAQIDAVYYCPHHPVHGHGSYLVDCDCRKPKPGMILNARRDFGVDLAASVLLGDSVSDMAAGAAAGVGACIDVHEMAHTAYDRTATLDAVAVQRALRIMAEQDRIIGPGRSPGTR